MDGMIVDPKVATRIARQHIDERVLDAQARHTAREVRRAARAQSPVSRPRRTWRIGAVRRAFA